METINICLKVLRNNKKAVKRRFQLKQVPKFSSASELQNFIVTEKSSVSFFTKIQIRIFNPKTDISFFFFFFYKTPKTIIVQMIHNVLTEVDSLDHIQNQILWKGFLTTTDPKRVNIASGNSKKNLYIHQLFDKTAYLSAFFEPESWIKRSILSVLSGW